MRESHSVAVHTQTPRAAIAPHRRVVASRPRRLVSSNQSLPQIESILANRGPRFSVHAMD